MQTTLNCKHKPLTRSCTINSTERIYCRDRELIFNPKPHKQNSHNALVSSGIITPLHPVVCRDAGLYLPLRQLLCCKSNTDDTLAVTNELNYPRGTLYSLTNFWVWGQDREEGVGRWWDLWVRKLSDRKVWGGGGWGKECFNYAVSI